MAAFIALELHHDRCTIALAQRLVVVVGEHMTPGFVAFRPVTPAAQTCLVRSEMSTTRYKAYIAVSTHMILTLSLIHI